MHKESRIVKEEPSSARKNQEVQKPNNIEKIWLGQNWYLASQPKQKEEIKHTTKAKKWKWLKECKREMKKCQIVQGELE